MILGFLIIFILSVVTDTILENAGVLPRGTLPLKGSVGLLLVVLAYRALYSLIGCYVAARLAPRNSMKHALAVGIIGVVVSILGSVAMSGKAPVWYDVVLIAMTLPIAWLGGKLQLITEKKSG